MISNSQTATPPPRNRWGEALLFIVIIGWATLIGYDLYRHQDIIKVALKFSIPVTAAGVLFSLQEIIKRQCEANSRKHLWSNIIYWVHLALIGWALWFFYPVSPAKMFNNIATQIKDSMNVQRKNLSGTTTFKDCFSAGRTLKRYQIELTDSLLIAHGIDKKMVSDWKRRIDSVVGDPMLATCSLADWQKRFEEEVSRLTKRKAVKEVDALMERFGIATNAQAFGQLNDERFRYGTIRNFLIRTVQGIQPMFIHSKPQLSDQFRPISEIIFLVKLNN